MPPEQILCLIERAAPLLIAGVFAHILARKLGLTGVAKVIARAGGLLLVGAVVVALLGQVHRIPVDRGLVAWLAVGLPVYVFIRWRDGAPYREALRDRIEQARQAERKRGPLPPTNAPTAPSPHGPTQQGPGGAP